jgi:hypothetical protein
MKSLRNSDVECLQGSWSSVQLVMVQYKGGLLMNQLG